jgi:Family of unknown function (DUF6014)
MTQIIALEDPSVDTPVGVQTAPTVTGDPNIGSQKVLESVHPDIRAALQIVTDIETGNINAAIEGLRQLALESSIFPRNWLSDEARALETGNYKILSEGFVDREFVGKDGYFLIIANYLVRREGSESIEPTAILGKISDRADTAFLESCENFLKQEFGILKQSISIIQPYEQISACGHAAGESGEAFIVANGWQIPDSHRFVSLNNMTEQRRRFEQSGQKCIEQIWEPDSAQFLMQPLRSNLGSFYRALEYQLHAAGHASGWGLNFKNECGLFERSFWSGSVEESHSDGILLELASKVLSPEQACKIAAVNICTRQALDAHRLGGLNRDGDVGASLINFARIWDSGEIGIKQGRLALRDLTPEGLLRAVKPLREWAVQLTHNELRLDHAEGLFRLYGSVQIHPAVEAMFTGLVVEPCQGLFPQLR